VSTFIISPGTRGPKGPAGEAGPAGPVVVPQGLLADIPPLALGQTYFATDVNILYVGTEFGNAPTTALPLFGLQADIPFDLPIGILYFATDTNVLFVSTGPGNVRVVPALLIGTLADIPTLNTGIFYLTSDSDELYIGTSGGNVAVGPSPAVPSNILIATVTLTSAQLLALSTTPIPLVAAPGAGKYIFPQMFVLEYLFGSVAYHPTASTNNAFINWTGQAINSNNAPVAIPGWGVFIAATASSVLFGSVANAAASAISLASATNKGLNFGIPNPVTLGNGTLRVTLVYSILSA